MTKEQRLTRGIIFIILGVGMLVAFIVLGNKDWKKVQPKDGVKFHEEYTKVPNENVFVYKTHNEINELLEKGTGVVYLGFPECPWCQAYVPYLNEVAMELDIKEIAYFNIKESRANDTVAYRKTVDLLKEFLPTNDEGIKRIYVPEVVVVEDGKILNHNNDTSMLSGSDISSYWTESKVSEFKLDLRNMLLPLTGVCTNCNE